MKGVKILVRQYWLNFIPFNFSSFFFFSFFFSPLPWRGLQAGGEVFAQYSFSRWDSIPVTISGSALANPWTGGLNFPQFSTIDLDGDSIEDLFVFDRTGNKKLTFINRNIPDSAAFTHQPQYQALFPDMAGWTLLADFNNDGKNDIFTANPKGGVIVYQNDFQSGVLEFSLRDSMLRANLGQNEYDIYVSPWDIPAIDDIDSDGDLDILSFSVGGFYVVYYKNRPLA